MYQVGDVMGWLREWWKMLGPRDLCSHLMGELTVGSRHCSVIVAIALLLPLLC